MTWRDSAACLGAPTEWFFPTKGTSTRRAKRSCASCPVIVECGEYANVMDRDGDRTGPPFVLGKFGVWGGLSAAERQDQRTGGSRALRGRQ